MKFHLNVVSVRARGLMLAAVVAVLSITSLRANGKRATLTGIVSDSTCSAKHMMSGDDAKCVRSCMGSGAQYALLVGNKVYVLKGKLEDLSRLAAQEVTVTGNLDDSVFDVTSVAPTQPSPKPAHAPADKDHDDTPPPIIIEGLVRDVACPIQNKQATAAEFNLKCAQECARLGSPLIVLTRDGTLYLPISESMPDQDQRQRLMPFLGKYVRVTGAVFERNGTRAIAIRTIEEVKGVPLKTDAE